MSKASSAIIIGAGVAGLASAIRLSLQGFEVTVFEKNDYPGGKLSDFQLNGYQFDAGPSLFTQPQNIEALFELANEPIADYFQYKALPIAFKYFYEDGTVINAYTNAEDFANELENKLGADGKKLQAYLAQSKKLYQDVGSIFLNYSLHTISTLFKAPIFKALKTVRLKHLFNTMHALNAKHFSKEQTIQLFNRYATYNGSNPYQAPGILSLIPHLEHNEGTYYPMGGMISITNALYQLALKKGVKFQFNAEVQNIISADKKVKGVLVNEQLHAADMVVSNIDVYFTYKNLLKNEILAKKVLRQERSSSALIFYWGINKEFSELELHNIFFSKNYKAEFEAIFKTKTFYADPTIYINITSKCEPGKQAKSGTENWFVMVNVPANIGQDWEAYRLKYRAVIIEKLNRLLHTSIESFIEAEAVLDPILIDEKTGSYQGSLYGTSSNSKMAAFMRHPNFSKELAGMYFVGGSVHPGGGIPLCLQSAKIMSELVKKNNSKSSVK